MTNVPSPSRRRFLQTAAAGAAAPYFLTSHARAAEGGKRDRPRIGAIGVGGQGRGIALGAARHGDIVAVADVDALRTARFQGIVEGRFRKRIAGHRDYRRVLENKDIDVVTIGTPDHWHTKIAIEAMQAGKDVYCEKPLTLTVEEGQLITKAARETGRVFQVGTQQRSDQRNFLTAIALIREGRIGKVERIWVGINGAPTGGPFKKSPAPATLDWDFWQGQTAAVDHIAARCHYTFRWWYEYSGGKLTDWGAHHVDIAQWAVGLHETGPTSVTPLSSKHPVDLVDGYPAEDNRFNTANKFQIDCQFADGVQLRIADKIEEEVATFGNGILFEGTEGRVFVNRGKITGKPVEELKENPLPEDALQKVYKGRKPTNHMADFFDCVETREEPISDVFSHHRCLTTCHLANIAIRLGRSLQWDPETETLQGDPQASAMLSREQRSGYEIPRV